MLVLKRHAAPREVVPMVSVSTKPASYRCRRLDCGSRMLLLPGCCRQKFLRLVKLFVMASRGRLAPECRVGEQLPARGCHTRWLMTMPGAERTATGRR